MMKLFVRNVYVRPDYSSRKLRDAYRLPRGTRLVTRYGKSAYRFNPDTDVIVVKRFGRDFGLGRFDLRLYREGRLIASRYDAKDFWTERRPERMSALKADQRDLDLYVHYPYQFEEKEDG